MGTQIPDEVLAGIFLAAIAILEVMGYTKIAGRPVVTGLYTILIPTFLFALFGSSRHVVVGADSATAAIMAAGLSGLAVPASPGYIDERSDRLPARGANEQQSRPVRCGLDRLSIPSQHVGCEFLVLNSRGA